MKPAFVLQLNVPCVTHLYVPILYSALKRVAKISNQQRRKTVISKRLKNYNDCC